MGLLKHPHPRILPVGLQSESAARESGYLCVFCNAVGSAAPHHFSKEKEENLISISLWHSVFSTMHA